MTNPDIVVFRVSGAFFFGATAGVSDAVDRIGAHPKAYVIDFDAASILDSTASTTVVGFARQAAPRGAAVFVSRGTPAVRRNLRAHGARPPIVRFRTSLPEGIAAASALFEKT